MFSNVFRTTYSKEKFLKWHELSYRFQGWIIFLGFFSFFLLLLLPVPTSGSILGSVDNLFIPSISNTYLNRIENVLFNENSGQSMYPADIARYGENSLGGASIFIFFRTLGLDDIYSLYFTQAFLLSSMAFATTLFARLYTNAISSAIFAAFIFTTSNFVWADIDHLAIHYYFIPMLGAYLLKLGLSEKKTNYLLLSGIIGGLQFYFSIQVFIYQCMIFGVLVLFSIKEFWTSFSLKEKLFFIAPYVLIPIPLFLYFLNTVINLGVVDVWPRVQNEDIYTIQVADFLKTLPDKLINYPFVQPSAGGWLNVAHSAFTGLVAPFLAIISLKNINRQNVELLLIGFVGLLFSLGTTININGREFSSPLLFFYEYVPLSNYLRVEIRSYSLALLAMSILAGIGWESIAKALNKVSRAFPVVGLIFMFFFVAAENISWPLNKYETIQYPVVPVGYVEFFADKPNARILDLPSRGTSWPTYIDEIIYVLWQTKHERDIIGGVTGHYPLSRVEAQKMIAILPSEEAFSYFQKLGVTHIVWHDTPFLVCYPLHSTNGCDPKTGSRPGLEGEGYSWLNMTSHLELVFQNNVLRIYEIR